ncbi:hypothetical protein BDV18DRAFT_157171 [Aspergillus unguis]
MPAPLKQLENAAYSAGWIAALPHERAAAEAMLDERHAPPLVKHSSDQNIYSLGSIMGLNGTHNVVIASLPAGRYGITPAATTASQMLSSFQNIKFGLMVGIGGGIPDPNDEERDIRLGDVVVSKPEGSFGGVRQYDLGKATVGGFEERGFLACPPRVLLNAMSALQSKHETTQSEIPRFLAEMYERYPLMARPRQGPGYVHQGAGNDRLFNAGSVHQHGKRDCRECNIAAVHKRQERYDQEPYIFYGTIASGNKVIKDARQRDMLKDCLCVETEAAGLMNDFPCLVIRGICDYCDSHKNDRWQRYAAATAATYAKELLQVVDAVELENSPGARMIVSELQEIKSVTTKIALNMKHQHEDQDRKELYQWLSMLNPSARHSENQRTRVEGTGLWLLEDPTFQIWLSSPLDGTDLLCCFGDPGAGKTIISSIVIDHLGTHAKQSKAVFGYMYCDNQDQQHQTADAILGSIIKQLLAQLCRLPKTLSVRFEAFKKENKSLTTDELHWIFKLVCSEFDQIFVVFDALDELRAGQLRILLQFIRNGPPLKIFMTGRPYIQYTVEEFMKIKHCIIIEAHEQDIRQFVMNEIGGPNDIAPRAMDDMLRANIVKTVIDSAQKIFLLPVLQVRTVLQAITIRDREESLKHLPPDLGQAFAGTILRIQQQANALSDLAKRVITWIHLGCEILYGDMIMSALAVHDGDTQFDPRGQPDLDTLIPACHGLVVLEKETLAVRLVHYSLEEYFSRQSEIFGVDRAQRHNDIAATCLRYLGFSREETFEDLIADGNIHGLKIYELPAERKFFIYAALYWGVHLRKSNEAPGTAFNLAESYLRSIWNQSGSSMALVYTQLSLHFVTPVVRQPRSLPAHITALFGLTKLMARLMPFDINDPGIFSRTPLHIAAYWGHLDVVKFLIANGADVNPLAADGTSPLWLASYKGHADIVEALVEAGASIHTMGPVEDISLWLWPQ